MPTLLLLRRTDPSLPYPSCPVPAAGPFRVDLSFSVGPVSELVLVRRPKIGKRDLKADTLGLGVRVVLVESGRTEDFDSEEAVRLWLEVADSLPIDWREKRACWSGTGDEKMGRPTGAEARKLLCRLSERDVEERLLWMTGMGRPRSD